MVTVGTQDGAAEHGVLQGRQAYKDARMQADRVRVQTDVFLWKPFTKLIFKLISTWNMLRHFGVSY